MIAITAHWEWVEDSTRLAEQAAECDGHPALIVFFIIAIIFIVALRRSNETDSDNR